MFRTSIQNFKSERIDKRSNCILYTAVFYVHDLKALGNTYLLNRKMFQVYKGNRIF